MTFSICAVDGDAHGVAVATNAIGVGSTAPFVSRHGAVCTQAMTNTPLGIETLRLVGEGTAIDEAARSLLADDEYASLRQLHGVDRRGGRLAVTGGECEEWAGHRRGGLFTVAGNMLSNESTLEAVADGFASATDRPIDERLLAALEAGEAAGGDKRGEHAQSAALCVFDPHGRRLEHDLRVDEHSDAVTELHRLHEVASTTGSEWLETYPEVDLRRHMCLNDIS
ncbi:MAG: DUF1028 domain-containing protein [Halobacteriota archaeon]